MSSSSSDSDQEEKERLRDAVFGAESTITNQTINSDKEKNGKKRHVIKKSLRENGEEDVVTGFQATPECKQFIARKIDEYLESEISNINIVSTKESYQDKHKDFGIKLLSKSLKRITSEENKFEIKPKNKLPKKRTVCSSSEDDDEDLKRFQSAAVTHDFVMKSTAIKKHQEENQVDAMDEKGVKKNKKKHKKKKKLEIE